MLCMALGESLKGFSLLHAHSKVRGVTVAVTESEAGVCLALLVQGKCRHLDATQKLIGNGKDLHILIVISTGIVTARW